MRIEDELRKYTAQPSDAAWERFQAARTPAVAAAESGPPSHSGRERRLIPLWFWAAASVAAVAVSTWLGTSLNSSRFDSSWPAIPAVTVAAGSKTAAGTRATDQRKESNSPRTSSEPLENRIDTRSVAQNIPSEFKNSATDLPGPVHSIETGLTPSSEAFSGTNTPNPLESYIAQELAVSGAETGEIAEPAPLRANKSATTSWLQVEVALENGDLYGLSSLKKVIPGRSDRWSRSAWQLAQKQWERMRSGEPKPSVPLPESLTVTVDLKKLGQSLPLPDLRRGSHAKNEP